MTNVYYSFAAMSAVTDELYLAMRDAYELDWDDSKTFREKAEVSNGSMISSRWYKYVCQEYAFMVAHYF